MITRLTEAEMIPVEWIAINSDPAEANEIQKLYQQALNQLPAQTREIFLCSREKDMKYSEIAELTGLSVKSVEYHISKALDVFRKVLKDYLWMMIMLVLSSK
jgi:RNA polymerase sigma-70 factor (ECF subfamily)